MSRKKRSVEKTLEEKEEISRTIQIRLVEIARRLGTTVNDLLESYGDPKTIIEKFDSGNISLLVEQDDDDA